MNATRRAGRAAQVGAARATARWRRLPDTLVIGTQRGGTTYLFDCLAAHPMIARPFVKEVHYFTDHWHCGEAWYRAHFPLAAGGPVARDPSMCSRTVDATPYYLFHPHAAERAARTVPHARVVALLRCPADRAYSHYQHSVRRGWETMPFDAALECEPDRIAAEHERIVHDTRYRSIPHRVFSYAARGRYAAQLDRWFTHFSRDRVLVIRSEDLFANPEREYLRTLDFLGLPRIVPDIVRRRRDSAHGHAPARVRDRLMTTFAEDNAQLAALIGRDMNWA